MASEPFVVTTEATAASPQLKDLDWSLQFCWQAVPMKLSPVLGRAGFGLLFYF